MSRTKWIPAQVKQQQLGVDAANSCDHGLDNAFAKSLARVVVAEDGSIVVRLDGPDASGGVDALVAYFLQLFPEWANDVLPDEQDPLGNSLTHRAHYNPQSEVDGAQRPLREEGADGTTADS